MPEAHMQREETQHTLHNNPLQLHIQLYAKQKSSTV